mgnify:CR=1 FL=1
MKMKERFHAICRFLTMVSQGNHRVLFWLLGSAFAAATLPYLSLFFSARILNLLLAKSYRACLYTVVVFLLTQYGLGLFEKICRQYLDGQKELCLARTEQKITAKALELEFEKFEKTETMDAIRRTNVSSMGSGNVGDQLIVIHTLITSLLSVLYALFFLLRLFLLSDSSRKNFFTSPFSMLALLLLCGVQLALSSRINRRSTQKKIELNQGNDHSNSVANYLANATLEERRADDIRIGHFDHFLDTQFGKAMEHFLPMYLDFARFSAITDGKNALLSLLSNFAAYLVIGARALYGVLPIGDVLLYAGSVTRAMSDLQTFLATGSEFDYINSYLSTYEDFIAQPSMAYDGTLPIEKRDDGQYEFAFHDVSFSYPGTDLPVLEHVTLSFAVGDKTALVGRNGAGKTTLIKLLCRLYEPTSGYITLNGIDIRKYSYKEYTQAFSVVFQDFHLLGKIREGVHSAVGEGQHLVARRFIEHHVADEPASAQAGVPVDHRPHQIPGAQKALHQKVGAALPHLCHCQGGALGVRIRLHQGVICRVFPQALENLPDVFSVSGEHRLGNSRPAGLGHRLHPAGGGVGRIHDAIPHHRGHAKPPEDRQQDDHYAGGDQIPPEQRGEAGGPSYPFFHL